MERIAYRQAYLVAVGTSAVHSDKDLPVGFFDGMASSLKEAQVLAFRTNAARRRTASMRKAADGLPGVLGQ